MKILKLPKYHILRLYFGKQPICGTSICNCKVSVRAGQQAATIK